jgi:chemotaxis protein methyltransferase CheR
LTTNETYFFREEKHWEYFTGVILPAIVRERRAKRQISIWSAASSTGEELYTAAILLLEKLPDFPSWTLKLVGTDINQEVLERARRGVYLPYAIKMTDPKIVAKYFDRGQNSLGREEWRLKEAVRRLCRFAPHNLQQPPAFGGFDLVICRNVFIYFDQAAKEKAVANLLGATSPGGHLFFSHTEAMVPRLPGMELVKPSIFRKVTS